MFHPIPSKTGVSHLKTSLSHLKPVLLVMMRFLNFPPPKWILLRKNYFFNGRRIKFFPHAILNRFEVVFLSLGIFHRLILPECNWEESFLDYLFPNSVLISVLIATDGAARIFYRPTTLCRGLIRTHVSCRVAPDWDLLKDALRCKALLEREKINETKRSQVCPPALANFKKIKFLLAKVKYRRLHSCLVLPWLSRSRGLSSSLRNADRTWWL